ncbi:MAG: PepSY domain-containing protein [Thaumarchaeota archaeon]|nr:PepSY domain-containing protein [Nitrososphaerota archaeon]
MNKIISNKKTMLGIVLGLALVAAIGTTVSVYADTPSFLSTNGTGTTLGKAIVTMPTIQGSININQLLMQSVKTKFVDAANAAQSAVTGGTVTGGQIGPYQGYYVYNFQVLDSSGNTYIVIVDAGNGQVLSNTGVPDGFSGMPGKVMMFRTMGGSMGDMSYQAMNPAEGPVVIGTAPSK